MHRVEECARLAGGAIVLSLLGSCAASAIVAPAQDAWRAPDGNPGSTAPGGPVQDEALNKEEKTTDEAIEKELKGIRDELSELSTKVEEARSDRADWWDLAVGYAYFRNAIDDRSGGGGGNDVSAALVQFKAYPSRLTGGWRWSDDSDRNRYYDRAWTFDRAYVAFGVSVGSVSGDGGESNEVESPVWTLGVGYDVIPEFGLMLGVSAFEETEEDGERDEETAIFFGVTLDPSIFAKLLDS
jgi:hypothetical protein